MAKILIKQFKKNPTTPIMKIKPCGGNYHIMKILWRLPKNMQAETGI